MDDKEMFKPLDNLGGAAVRGEAPSLTEAELDAMPRRAAFIAWAKDRSLDTTETKDAWGQRAFLHDHIETMWIGWFHAPDVSARAADAPSEPSERTDLSHRLRETADKQPGWKRLLTAAADEIERYYGAMLAWKKTAEKKDADYNNERMERINDRIKSRAADALDSQPSITAKLKEWEAYAKSTSLDERNGDLCQMIAELMALDSQPKSGLLNEFLADADAAGITHLDFKALDSQPTDDSLDAARYRWLLAHPDDCGYSFYDRAVLGPTATLSDAIDHQIASSQPTYGGVRNG